MITVILNLMQHFFNTKDGEFTTRKKEKIISWKNHHSDTIFADCLFVSIEATQNNGGAICVNKPIYIAIKKTKFQQYSSIKEGGSLYISSANASLFCLVFSHSHARTRAENIGGNALSVFDSELRMSDFVVYESWIDMNSGDGVHHIVRCSSEITRYNISDSIEGYYGGACGDFWTQNADSLVSFANLVNNKGKSGFVTFFGGIFLLK